jgi:prepilin peptidase CpaA
MGAGDVKLMAAIGTIKGFKFTFSSILFAAIAGIIVTFCYLAYKKKLFSYFRKYLMIIAEMILKYVYFSNKNVIGNKLRKFAYSKENENNLNEKLYIPYGLAIALGTLFELSGIFKTYLLF